MNDILRSFRTEYKKTPVKLQVCIFELVNVDWTLLHYILLSQPIDLDHHCRCLIVF